MAEGMIVRQRVVIGPVIERHTGLPFGIKPHYLSIPIFFVLVLVGWELFVVLLRIQRYVLPPPTAIIESFGKNFTTIIVPHAFITLREIYIGFGISACLGVSLGFVIAKSRLLESTIHPYLVGLQSIPTIATAPLLVLWLGYGIESKIGVAALISFFTILTNTMVGIRSVNRDILKLTHLARASRWKTFIKVEAPSSLPWIFTGLKLGVLLAAIGAVVSEFVGARGGLGYLITLTSTTYDTALMFADIVTLGSVSISNFLILSLLESRFLQWHESKRQ